jgi:hypothetical protein
MFSPINFTGNLGERGYGPESVAEELERIAAVCPSLKVKVHCGGDYETLDCVATVSLESGKAKVGDPEVQTIGPIPDGQMMQGFLAQPGRR